MNRTQLAAGLLLGMTLACHLAHAAPGERPVVYTSRTKFRIPFKFNPEDLQVLGARQVVLYMSNDRGGRWHQVQAVSPEAGKFNFEAPQDGEYWFVVRTLDGKNRLLPDDRVTDPELQVVVDTQRPTLKLELRQSSAGRVVLRWTATDANLDPTQLRLEYSQPGIDAWQNVSIIPKASGQTEWTVPGNGIVAVRGIVADLAKNTQQDQATLKLTGAKSNSLPDFTEPVAGQDVDRRAVLAAPSLNSTRFIPAARQPESPQGIVISHQRELSDPLKAPADPVTRNRFRVVSSAEFHIGYRIQDVGPSGVSAVELHATEDDGRTWRKFTEDDDTESPIPVRVPGEGTYGFAFVIRSGVGLSADPPGPGDKPEVVVAVDQTPPTIELLPLEQGRGLHMNKVLIQWRYEDAYPAEKPVSISFATEPHGPWQPLTGWTENTGRYIWTVGQSTPPRFFLRIEARDAAGNTSLAETPDPVLIDLSRPSAKVLDVMPARPQ